MNKQEIEKAIEALKNVTAGSKLIDTAIKTAIKCMEYQLTNGWIPTTKRNPDKAGYYLITGLGLNTSNPFIEYAYYDKGKSCKWLYIADGNEEEHERWEEELVVPVIAWQHLPEPFTQQSIDSSQSKT